MDHLKINLKSIVVLLVALTFIPVCTVFADVNQEVDALILSLETALEQQQADEVIALYHPDYDLKTAMQQNLQKAMDEGNMPRIRMEVLEVTQYDAGVLATIATTTTQPGEDSPEEKIEVLTLKPFEGKLKIRATYEAPEPESFDDQSRVFSSVKGKYAVTVPEEWMPLKASSILQALTSDALVVLAPDFESQVMIGFVQLPLKLGDDNAETAKKGALVDMDVEKRMTVGHQVFDQGEIRIAGLDGYRIVTQFEGTKEGGITPRKRLRVYFADHPMLYFMVCDAIGPEQYDSLRPQFDALVSSFHLLPVDAGLSRREAIAAEQARGAVTGQVYTSDEFNCFIAAPSGWEIRTSSNPAHLVEMQYAEGKSIARLIAAQGLPESANLSDVVSSRIQQVKGIALDFSEISRGNITVMGTPGIESVQTYRLEEFGTFHIKEWTLIHDGTYYLILCQCIEPDDYSVLEKDFDQILQSFGFIQN